ncbi:hypothetical protein HUT16_33005 [Kitasatospora sp. NA04385]|uniref:hypothetical protein n=1 Tax=Kitasatospora sp. NA04385 TaxID=2742135 RepID=UPI0015926819|nr:hypothetical protein [Kitasatospora sp. NA04385]QKW23266.1 hypothetical protein HUT16_33005 [Kitasatospora sp. NA04385]
MTAPDRTPKTPDLPPAPGTEAPDMEVVVPDTGPAAEEGRDRTEGPAPERNRTAAETTEARSEDEPPD